VFSNYILSSFLHQKGKWKNSRAKDSVSDAEKWRLANATYEEEKNKKFPGLAGALLVGKKKSIPRSTRRKKVGLEGNPLECLQDRTSNWIEGGGGAVARAR